MAFKVKQNTVYCRGVCKQWTGQPDWITGLDYWTAEGSYTYMLYSTYPNFHPKLTRDRQPVSYRVHSAPECLWIELACVQRFAGWLRDYCRVEGYSCKPTLDERYTFPTHFLSKHTYWKDHISQCSVTYPSLSKHIQTIPDKKITKKWPFQYISIIRIHMETCAVCAVLIDHSTVLFSLQSLNLHENLSSVQPLERCHLCLA